MNEFELETGQVWELKHDDMLTPSILLRHVCALNSGIVYWLCLDLISGDVFRASDLRWWGNYKPYELVGERLF